MIASPADVHAFAESHKLTPLVREGLWQVQKYFPGSNCRAELSTSPEDGSQSIWVRIECKGSAEQASAALRRFDDGWWLERCADAKGLLNFITDLA